MGFRDAGTHTETRAVSIQICDICGADIGITPFKSRPHYQIERDPSWGDIDSPEYAIAICSVACLRTFAAAETDPANRDNMSLKVTR